MDPSPLLVCSRCADPENLKQLVDFRRSRLQDKASKHREPHPPNDVVYLPPGKIDAIFLGTQYFSLPVPYIVPKTGLYTVSLSKSGVPSIGPFPDDAPSYDARLGLAKKRYGAQHEWDETDD